MSAELVQQHMGLVYAVARKVQRRGGADFETLVDHGITGLKKAAAAFDPERGLKFSTFAVPTIRGYILNGVNRAGDSDQRRIRRDRNTLATLTHDLASFLGRDPSVAELAEASGLSVERVGAALVGSPTHIPLHEDTQPIQDPSGRQVAAELSAHLDALQRDPRQREILTRRYGLDGSEPQTYEAIGHVLGLSRPRVQQLERAALATLSRHPEVQGVLAAYIKAERARMVARPTGARKRGDT